MPISCPLDVRPLTAEEFQELDYRVMGHAFASQNMLGRLCEEQAYQRDLQARLLADGFQSVHIEVPISVSHKDFCKDYFVDLVADDALYELKTAVALSGEHQSQLLNYLFLLGVPRGKLINFRPPRVQGRIHASGVTPEDRRRFHLDSSRWQELSTRCETLRGTMHELLADWGAFLDFELYQQALAHFSGGECDVIQRLPLTRGRMTLPRSDSLVPIPLSAEERQRNGDRGMAAFLMGACRRTIPPPLCEGDRSVRVRSMMLALPALLVAVLFGCQGEVDEGPGAAPSQSPRTVEPPADEPGDAPAGGTPDRPADTPSTTAAVSPSDAGCYWPRFHGPRGDNISDDTGLLAEWPEGGPPLVWTATGIGEGYSCVTIAEGLIYTAGNIDEKSVVTALRLDGQAEWQRDNGPAWTGSYPGTRSTPTIDGDRLYDESPLGQVTCYKAKTGEKLWSRNILDEFGSKNIQWALAESVLIDGPRVICSPGGPNTAVVALDKMTGETVWQSPTAQGDLAGYCSPTLVEYQGLRMIFVMTARGVIGVNAEGGELLFRFPHKTQYDINVEKPIFRDGMLFFTSGYSSGSVMLKLTVDGGNVSVEEAWRNKDLDNHHGGVLLLDGYLYGSDMRTKWVCLDWKTGQTMYAERGVGKGSLTSAEGMLYVLSEKHRVGLAPATPEKHEVVSRFELPEGGEGNSWAHPVVCGGRLYLRHGDFLYAYDVKAK